MKSNYLGDLYFIKNGKVLKDVATINDENISKQSFPGLSKALRLYSDKELENGSKDIIDIYKRSLDDNTTIVRVFHKAIGNMGEVTLLEDYDVDVYIPLKPSMMDIDRLREVLSNYNNNSLTIANLRSNDYDFYDYLYNYSYNERKPYEICELFYKEKNLILDDNSQKMFDKYREFNMASLVLEDYSKYPLNNRNTGVVIIMPDLIIKRTVTKSFHKKECLGVLKRFYEVNDASSYVNLVSTYNLVIGIITKDTISAYVSSDINDYQLNELLTFVKETYDIKSIKDDLITNVNIIKDGESIYIGELSDVRNLGICLPMIKLSSCKI